MRSLSSLLNLPSDDATDEAIRDHIDLLVQAIGELDAAEVELENRLAARRAKKLLNSAGWGRQD